MTLGRESLVTRRSITVLGTLAVVASALSAATTAPAIPAIAKESALRLAVQGKLHAARLRITVPTGGPQSHAAVQTYRTLPFFSGALLDTAKFALAPDGADLAGSTGPDNGSGGSGKVTPAQLGNGNNNGRPGTLGMSLGTIGCSQRIGGGSDESSRSLSNVRVNQDCSYRRQAEEDITYNPQNPSMLTAGQNDSRVGYNQCGIDWSINNGQNWGDMLPPFRQRTNSPETDGPNSIGHDPGTHKTYDFASDPAPAIDADGNAYFSCVMIDLDVIATGLYVTQSPAAAQGSFYYNVPDAPSRRFITVEDNNPLISHDKNMIAADRYKTLPNGRANPNRDNVYVTWTVFKFAANCVTPDNPGGYCESPIYGSMSTDHALTWSAPEIISGDAPLVCSFGNAFNSTLSPSDCNFDQGSYPVVNPDGTLAVTFNNGNTAAGNPNAQTLGIHCAPTGNSAAGTAHLNCTPPTKVGDDVIVGEPRCDFGRGPEECVPGPYIRTNDFPRITKDNTQNGHLYSVWQDYRNGEYDIQMSQSLDGGLTWHEVGTVNPDRGLDHYFPATDQAPTAQERGDRSSNSEESAANDRNGVSYYRSERVPNENTTPATGFAPCNPNQGGDPAACNAGVGATNSDYVLSGGRGAHTPYNFKVISPVFPPPDGNQTGFNGDYSGLTVNRGIEAHPIWSDTRNADPFPLNGNSHDEDVFTATVSLPDGQARLQTGHIGRGGSGGDDGNSG